MAGSGEAVLTKPPPPHLRQDARPSQLRSGSPDPGLLRHGDPPRRSAGDPRRRRQPPRRPSRRRELQLWAQGYERVAGVDEVGRGPLAGPVVAGAVVLRPLTRPRWLRHVRDSKQLAPSQRRELAAAIKASAAWGIGWSTVGEIDGCGILEATRLAMRRALVDLCRAGDPPADFVLVDGRDRHRFACPFETIIGGDARCTSIAAASVIAKVARDAWMEAIAADHQGYEFAQNKGYATPAHLTALRDRGPCAEHRFSFAPVRASSRQALRPAPQPLAP